MTDTMLLFAILVCVVLFWGTPDLMDAIIANLQCRH